MKKLLLLFTFLLLFASILLVSCKEEEADGDAPVIPKGTVVLNVYNWGEYISDGSLGTLDVNAEFEKYYYEKTGVRVKVNYTTYATNEDMYSKITSGAGTYDIIIPSDYMIERLKNEDMLYAFDPATTVENYGYINDFFKDSPYYDPDNLYSVPYTYGMVGIIYNSALVDEEDVKDKSWGLMWNEKYRGKILQFNNPRDGFATAMYYLDIDINSTNKADWDRALAKMLEQKPLVQGYVSDEIFNKMTTSSAAIAAYYAGDYLIMSDEEDGNPDLAFYYPTEGTNFFVDAMCIPKNAKQKEIAIEYINFMLSEEIAVANAEYIGYASPNDIVKNNADYIEEMGEEAIEILYGFTPEEANANYSHPDPAYHTFTPEIQSYVNSLWEQLKTESSIELWIHITSGVLVASVLSLGIYTFYIKKKRSRHYRYRDREQKAKRAQ